MISIDDGAKERVANTMLCAVRSAYRPGAAGMRREYRPQWSVPNVVGSFLIGRRGSAMQD